MYIGRDGRKNHLTLLSLQYIPMQKHQRNILHFRSFWRTGRQNLSSTTPPLQFRYPYFLIINSMSGQTVKKQTFHKRSTNVPISNRNETQTVEFVPSFVLSKEIIFMWSRRADSGPKNRNNLFSIRQIRERFWFRFPNDIGTFALSF
jgi:hypothetical protein